MSGMTERCKACLYYCNCDGHYIYPTCDYMLTTGKRRGCPAGDECDKFIPSEECIKLSGVYSGVVRLPIKEPLLFDLYEQGLTDREIAIAVGTTLKVARGWRRKNGLPSQQDLKRGVMDEP